MIPYLPPPAPLSLWGLQIPVFGLCLFVGVVVAYVAISLRGRALGLAPAREMERFAAVILIAAAVGAHVAGRLSDLGVGALSHPSLFLSTTGTFPSAAGGASAAVAGAIYLRARRADLLCWADVAAFAFPFGWLFARAGCALAHDHPGRLSGSWLAVRFPDGARFDCGLLEGLATAWLIVLVLILVRRPRPAGLLAGAVGASYALIRFSIDFMRAADLPGHDARPGGLTVAQWLCLPLFAAGVTLLRCRRDSCIGASF